MSIIRNTELIAKRPSKIVCVGRNYAEHAKEMNSPITAEPILFLKPASSLTCFEDVLNIPEDLGSVHHELEIALLVGEQISKQNASDAIKGISAVGLAIDLTLRDLQKTLKSNGHPWERSKAFDQSCWLSDFYSVDELTTPLAESNFHFSLQKNGQLQQTGQSLEMIFSIAELTAFISQFFALEKGDIILTGTPSGVGPLNTGDQLSAQLSLDEQQLVACHCAIG